VPQKPAAGQRTAAAAGPPRLQTGRHASEALPLRRKLPVKERVSKGKPECSNPSRCQFMRRACQAAHARGTLPLQVSICCPGRFPGCCNLRSNLPCIVSECTRGQTAMLLLFLPWWMTWPSRTCGHMCFLIQPPKRHYPYHHRQYHLPWRLFGWLAASLVARGMN